MSNEQRTQVILIAGYARAGKDTLAKYLQELLPDSEIIHFADALKIATRYALNTLGLDDRGDKELIRPAWIGLGRTARNLEPDIFPKLVASAVKRSDAPYIIIPDWRYANEGHYFPEALQILLSRPNGVPMGEELASIAGIKAECSPVSMHCEEGLEHLAWAARQIEGMIAPRGGAQ